MVYKAAWYSLVIVAVILISTAAKPFSDEDKRDIAYYTEDALLADSQRKPPKIRMNRHGKRGIIEAQDYNRDAEYALYDMKDLSLADGPQKRLRMNRHGK